MPIQKLRVGNFKGVDALTEFDIRPMTIFIGRNSSGKSSCIHALTALSQTLKLGNSVPALVLDDDNAYVHLGRFTEIAHGDGYALPIKLGVSIGEVKLENYSEDAPAITGECDADFEFKSTKRTQEVFVDSARISVGSEFASIKRSVRAPYAFTAQFGSDKGRYAVLRTNNFMFSPTNAPKDLLEHWFNLFMFLNGSQKLIENEIRNTAYLGPFRQSPLRRYPYRGVSANEVGPEGGWTVTLLATEYTQSTERAHVKQINSWLKDLNLAKQVDLSRVGNSDLFDVKMTLQDGSVLPIADLGYGLSQVLPVLTQCSFARKGSTLLFEQPELHLHHGATSKLAKVFTDCIAEKNAHIVIETHAKELVQGVFDEVRAGRLAAEDIALYRVERVNGASEYRRIAVTNEDGYVSVESLWADTLAH